MNEIIRYDASTMSASDWATKIGARWHDSVEAIIDVGRMLIEAKAALDHGDFGRMCREALPFTARTAQRLMAIGGDPRLSNTTLMSHLPPSWSALYEITRLDDDNLGKHLAAGTIRPDMAPKDISTAVKQQVRSTREIVLGLKQIAAPVGVFGVIVEDFEWDHETWSEAGRDRAAENHYPVAKDAHTAAAIVEKTKDRFAVAADDCFLGMWATIQHLAIAIDVMRLRGFTYKSHYAWPKDKAGLGYWNREKHELMLIGTKGNIMCPAQGTQFDSWRPAPRTEHSAKPDLFMEMIEGWYPTLPKLELNSRRPRPGWTVWGFNAETSDAIVPAKAQVAPPPVRPVIATVTRIQDEDIDLTIPSFLRREERSAVLPG